MGQPKDRGVVNCKINSFTIRSLKHSCFNENDQIWGCKLCHMGQLKDWGCLNCKRNSMKIKSLSSAKFQRARAEELVLLVFFERAGGQAPQLWEAWPSARARARARALSTNQNFKITTFLLVNFINDHGESCSVSRDWQPPKISARSVPVEKSYDQNKFFYLQTWPVTWSSIPGILKELKDRVLRRLIRPSTKIATQTWYASFLTFNTIGSLLYRKHFWWKRKFYLGQKRHEHSQNFELFLQFPRSQRHPVCTLSHLVNLNIMIFLCSGKSLDVRRLDVRRRCKT